MQSSLWVNMQQLALVSCHVVQAQKSGGGAAPPPPAAAAPKPAEEKKPEDDSAAGFKAFQGKGNRLK